MTYREIDELIEGWAEKNSVVWMKRFGGEERRFFYKSNSAGESYQVYIEPVADGEFEVKLVSVERFDKDDVEYTWRVGTASVVRSLDEAVAKMELLARS